MSKHTSEITIKVDLDENKVPEKLRWSAPDGGIQDSASKAIFLSVWDEEDQTSLRMDLWTKEMPVDQMQVFVHQTLVGMRESYLRATNDTKMSAAFQDFCEFFAQELKLKKVSKQ